MEFDHERLHVYQLALEFLAFAEQLTKVSAADKRRYYVSASGSAIRRTLTPARVLLHPPRSPKPQ
jgi:hypothetical protein